MKARTRAAATTLVLLAGAAAAISVAWFGVHLNVAEEKARDARSKKLFALDPAKVTSAVVAAKGGEVKLVRAGAGWRITSPVEADADPDAVRRLLDGLAGLERRATSAAAGASPAELASYGLAAPKGRIEVAVEGGHTERLALGDTNGFDGAMFVMPTDGEVAVVAGEARAALELGLDDLRDRRVLPAAGGEVERLRVKGPKLAYVLARDGVGWRLEAPLRERADDAAAERIVGALRALRASSVEDAPGADRAYGLDRPRWEIAVVAKSGPEQAIAVGAAPGAAKTAPLHARRGGEARLYEVAPASLAALEVDLATLRDRRVLRFEKDKVAALRFETAEGAFELRKVAPSASGADTWRVVAPRDAPAVSWKVSGLVWTLASLDARAFFDESGKRAAEAGLDPARETVTVKDAAGQELARLSVGKDLGQDVLVRAASSPRIYALEKTRLSTLPRSVAEVEETKAP